MSERDPRTLAPGDIVATFRAPEAPASSSELVAEPHSNVVPAKRYAALHELGRGGMGRVEVVFDAVLGRNVARKSLLVVDDTQAKLLVAEAQTAAQLEHPAIIPVYDLGGNADGSPFYTMREIRGRTFREVLRELRDVPAERRALTPIFAVFRQVCLAVDYAHERGVVHRDLKPSNIVVGRFGEVYVLDWGIALVLDGSDVLRSAQGAGSAGSPGYIAPEQAWGEEVSARADVFALGAILFEILTCRRAFVESTPIDIANRITQSTAESLRALVADLPEAFRPLVAACLDSDPAKRPERASAIAHALDDILDRERERQQRRHEADGHANTAFEALERCRATHATAKRLRDEAADRGATFAGWEPIEVKKEAWQIEAQAEDAATRASLDAVAAETAFARALESEPGHARARAGMASLHYHQLLEATEQRDAAAAARHLHLARHYDDGALALLLAREGELSIEVRGGDVRAHLERYVADGPLLRPTMVLGVDDARRHRLPSGSYCIVVQTRRASARFPVLVRSGMRHRISIDAERLAELPDGMVLVGGGTHVGFATPTAMRMEELALPDFAIGRFPITLGEYATFLESNDADHALLATADLVRDDSKGWVLAPDMIEGEAAIERIRGRERDLPAAGVSWLAARAYAEWAARRSGLPYRLPTFVEWDKASRGVDGRPYAMGHRVDPAFAKLRDSRPEASQPEPIGAFPLDESPYGVRDLIGGVGDWTATDRDGNPLPAGDVEDDRIAIFCGANWSSSSRFDPRMAFPQMVRHGTGWVGFRLALSLNGPPIATSTVESMK